MDLIIGEGKKPLKISPLRNTLMDLVLAPCLTTGESEANRKETFRTRPMWSSRRIMFSLPSPPPSHPAIPLSFLELQV
jgi:hypothetical protein